MKKKIRLQYTTARGAWLSIIVLVSQPSRLLVKKRGSTKYLPSGTISLSSPLDLLDFSFQCVNHATDGKF